MEEGKHLHYVKGIGVIAVHTDNDELMNQIEERKRIKRELQKNAGNHGDLQNGNEPDDDDDDLVEETDDDDLFDFDDGEATDDGHALVGNEVVRGLKTPRGPAVVPASITLSEVKDRFVEKATYSVNTMYKFWKRRLDGFSGRYVDSLRCRAVQIDVASKGKNIHVIAVISSSGLAYQESQFSSITADLANEFIRRFLRHISTTMPLDEVVVVLDIAPCHTDVEDVFDEEEFEDAEVLKLGPYSPMLNPIENVLCL
ncbi:Hypothetical protein PHPALM_1399 [Phytophthora palmivora]|uniref:Tc1-like transposase DDE domain-containing protein n=1 Tax=Phytophthora palmivora TaxID=4796 RepID=A0A2P4YSI4_9STRA|nr:Hypothetical protein PHPALM_1399 [Phytophthora palmivora]